VSQSVSQILNLLKIPWLLLKAFQVDLKPSLDVFLPNQTAPSSSGKIEAGFWVILLCGPCLLLHCPYYEPLLWFMIIAIHIQHQEASSKLTNSSSHAIHSQILYKTNKTYLIGHSGEPKVSNL